MAVKVDTVEILKKYFSGVTDRANHHAPNVREIIYSLLGIIILKKDKGTDIEVRGSDNNSTGNILWVTINQMRYALRYEHSNDTIEVRKNSYNGDVILKINNQTQISDILKIF